MTTPTLTAPPLPTDDDKTFPVLTAAQIERIAAHGQIRRVENGEILLALGKKIPLFFVVKSGTIDIVQPGRNGEMVLGVIRHGLFTGEVSILSGRRALVTLRVGDPGELIEDSRDELLKIVQSDAQLSQ